MQNRRYKSPIDRGQQNLLPPSIEDYVARDNPVRAIDAYVDTLDLQELGFTNTDSSMGAGQPAFNPSSLLRLYLYGYLNYVRSSRRLERETYRNLEVIWLLGDLHPCYKTIADFRKDNGAALKGVNRDFILLCRELELFGAELVAIDGSFFKASANKSTIHTQKKLDRQIARLEKNIAEYLEQLDDNDRSDGPGGVGGSKADDKLAEKLAFLQKRRKQSQALRDKLEKSGDKQLSTTDKDARLLSKGGQTVAGFNVQSVVDDKHKLIVASEVSHDGNDQNQLYGMADEAKKALGVDHLTAVADAGYYEGNQLKQCEDAGITAYVPAPDKSGQTRTQGRFTREAFVFEIELNAYRCPQGYLLARQGKASRKNNKLLVRYASKAAICKACPQKQNCLTAKARRRQIYRWQHEDVVERHRARMHGAGAIMAVRGALVEHPFGTLKCRAGWTHFLVRGFEKVRGEWSLMVTSYNFTRVLNILGVERLVDYCAKRRARSCTAT